MVLQTTNPKTSMVHSKHWFVSTAVWVSCLVLLTQAGLSKAHSQVCGQLQGGRESCGHDWAPSHTGASPGTTRLTQLWPMGLMLLQAGPDMFSQRKQKKERQCRNALSSSYLPRLCQSTSQDMLKVKARCRTQLSPPPHIQ
jgi:hypothetical protein